MNDQNIRDLALEAAQGSVPAFQELYQRTRQGAWFVALSIAKNEHDAQDILQDSYLKAYKSMGQLEQPESFVPWLNQIVANKAKNYIARKKPESFADYGDENALDWQEETDPAFLPDEHLDREEAKALIASLVRELPEDQRLVVLLHYYDDMEVAAIAKSLEVPEGTVKSRLARARTKLAAMLRQAQGKGLKLYAMAPIPLLAYFIKLLGFDATGSDRLPPLLIGSAAAGTAAGGAAAAARKAPLATGKLAAIAAAAVVAVGGIAAAGVFASHRAPVAVDTTAAQQTAGTVTDDSESLAVSALFSVPEISEGTAPPVTRPEPSGEDNTRGSSAPETTVAGTAATEAPTTAKPTTTTAVRTTLAWPTLTLQPFSLPALSLPAINLPVFTTRPRTTAATTTATTTTTAAPQPAKPEFEYARDPVGGCVFNKYNGSQTHVTVPAAIDGVAVVHLGAALFEGTNVVRVEISPGIDCIREKSFANCPDLEEVVIPSSVRRIADDSFAGSPNVVLVCGKDSDAYKYAEANKIPFRLV